MNADDSVDISRGIITHVLLVPPISPVITGAICFEMTGAGWKEFCAAVSRVLSWGRGTRKASGSSQQPVKGVIEYSMNLTWHNALEPGLIQ